MPLRITPFSRPPALDARLERRRYQRFGESLVMVCEAAIETIPVAPLPNGLHFHEVETEAYAHIIGELRGTDEAQVQAHAQRLKPSPVPYRGMVLRGADGKLLACAQVAVDGELVGLYDVSTAPAQRGRGLSGVLCGQ
jgi:hypothetical protein